ncbi:hypothetical protein U1Q18_020266, partial [Sarracenia purpurea var. burkii]
ESPYTRLLNAALIGNLKLIKKLARELDLGDGLAKTLVDVKDSGGRSALHFAASGGKTHVCKYLVQELELDVNMKDGEGETPLNHATIGQHSQTASFLIGNGANLNLANHKGFSALHYAAEKGLKELLRQLISRGAEVDAKSDAGTPLQCAAAKGRKEIVKILLDNKANAGADPNLDSHGEMPIGIAASEGETEVIKCLLKAGANPNVTNIVSF